MGNYAPYRGRDTAQEKAELEREIMEVTQGFSFLRNFPCFATSVKLAKEVTKLLGMVPSDRWLGWADQIERASVSVCCNLAEGAGRGTIPMLHNFFRTARGSAYEVLALVYVAPFDVPADVKDLAQQVCREIDGSVKDIAKDRLSRL
jgi:four helix bundle protein